LSELGLDAASLLIRKERDINATRRQIIFTGMGERGAATPKVCAKTE
jgi:hypothetical protein